MAASSHYLTLLTVFVVFLGLPFISECHTRSVECSTCISGRAQYPECLEKVTTCREGYYCSIEYKIGVSFSTSLTVGCTRGCHRTSVNSSDSCLQGGKLTNGNTCYKCCAFDSCSRHMKRLLKRERPSTIGPTTPTATTTTTRAMSRSIRSQVLSCPFQCQASDVHRCDSSRVVCTSSQYCNMVFNVGQGQIEGQCVERTLQHVCLSYLYNHNCPFSLETAEDFTKANPNLHGYCYLGCCSTSSCIDSIFVSNAASPAITTNMPPIQTSTSIHTTERSTLPSTPAPSLTSVGPGITNVSLTNISVTPSTSQFDYSTLKSHCSNKLRDNVCAILRDSKNICKLREALTLCPETCNICKVVEGMQCEDTAIAGRCGALIKDDDTYCRGNLSIFVCPKTCGLCDQMIKKIVDEVIQKEPLPDFDHPPSTPATLHCDEILDAGCDHVKALCVSSNLNQVCPDQCQTCM